MGRVGGVTQIRFQDSTGLPLNWTLLRITDVEQPVLKWPTSWSKRQQFTLEWRREFCVNKSPTHIPTPPLFYSTFVILNLISSMPSYSQGNLVQEDVFHPPGNRTTAFTNSSLFVKFCCNSLWMDHIAISCSRFVDFWVESQRGRSAFSYFMEAKIFGENWSSGEGEQRRTRRRQRRGGRRRRKRKKANLLILELYKLLTISQKCILGFQLLTCLWGLKN